MIRRFLIGAALLAVAVPVSVEAAEPSAPAAFASSEQQKLALELAHVMNSEELTRAQIAKMLTDTLPKTMADTPAFAEMERDHPGLTQVVIATMKPIILDGTLKGLPALWTRLVPIYARTFSAAEMRTLLDFYTSPAGARLFKTMAEGSDYSGMMSDMIASGNGTVTADGLRAGTQTGLAELIRTTSPEDLKAMQALAATRAGQKLAKTNPQLQAEAAAWANETDPEVSEHVRTAVRDAVIKFVGKPVQ